MTVEVVHRWTELLVRWLYERASGGWTGGRELAGGGGTLGG